MTEIVFSPVLPVSILTALAVFGVLAALLRLKTSLPGTAMRVLTVGLVILFLAGPERRTTEGEPLADIAVILTDESASMALAGRDEIATDAADRLGSAVQARGIEVRRARLPGTTQTDLSGPLTTALAGAPRARLSAVFVVTDGQLTDIPEPGALALGAPLHVLLAGDPESQIDRRVTVTEAPRYGVVGESVDVGFRIDGAVGPVPVTVYAGGEAVFTENVEAMEDVRLQVPLAAPGETVIEVAVPALAGEMTTRNNRAAMRIMAIRDRLRVLLVSGEPHPGERVWRNTLKSDPAVDLVHFTILKPYEKDAVATNPDELNLIAFPHEELFLEKLPSFDVVIFDRYTYRQVLQPYEFERVAAYVRAGGAVLVAAGPEFAERDSLAEQRSLAQILPVLPSDRAVETAFVPALSDAGERHPVTEGLDPTEWGRWLRFLPSKTTPLGEAAEIRTILEGPGQSPLLVLARVDDGRVAIMTSDHFWLWARGFDGGGPHREILRRLVHWLMQEPALEEEALSGRIEADTLTVRRRSLADDPGAVTIEAPDGTERSLPLALTAPGVFAADIRAEEPGLYRLRAEGPEGRDLFAVASTGEGGVREYLDVLTTGRLVAPLVEATGGGTAIIARLGNPLPSLRRVREGGRTEGTNWMGLVNRDAMAVTTVRSSPMLPRWVWLALALGAAVAAWLLESGKRQALSARR